MRKTRKQKQRDSDAHYFPDTMRAPLRQRARDRSDRLIKLRRTLVGQCLVRRVSFRTTRISEDRPEASERGTRSDSQDNARARQFFLGSPAFSLVAQLRGKVFGTAQNYPHRSRSRYLGFNDTAFCANFPPLLPPSLRRPASLISGANGGYELSDTCNF